MSRRKQHLEMVFDLHSRRRVKNKRQLCSNTCWRHCFVITSVSANERKDTYIVVSQSCKVQWTHLQLVSFLFEKLNSILKGLCTKQQVITIARR